MNLSELLRWTAELSGCSEVPADSQVYVEAPGDVRTVLFGVDIDAGELLWAQQQGFDAVIAHHPVGDRARTEFARVVHRQIDQMAAEGIDRATAERAVRSRLDALHRRDHMANVNRVVDTARLIGMPFANIHLAADILARQAVVDLLAQRTTPQSTLREVVAAFDELPEMEAAHTRPEAWVGSLDNRLGRYTVAMAGGTNGGYPVFREYFAAGIDTVLCMHIAEEELHRLRGEASPGNNLLVTGHMATDSVGINAVIAAMEREGMRVTRTSGVLPPG